MAKRAADPSTPPAELEAMLAARHDIDEAVVALALRNPSLPQGALLRELADGQIDAWGNPVVPLLQMGGEALTDDVVHGARWLLEQRKSLDRIEPEAARNLRPALHVGWTRQWAFDTMLSHLGSLSLSRERKGQLIGWLSWVIDQMLPFAATPPTQRFADLLRLRPTSKTKAAWKKEYEKLVVRRTTETASQFRLLLACQTATQTLFEGGGRLGEFYRTVATVPKWSEDVTIRIGGETVSTIDDGVLERRLERHAQAQLREAFPDGPW